MSDPLLAALLVVSLGLICLGVHLLGDAGFKKHRVLVLECIIVAAGVYTYLCVRSFTAFGEAGLFIGFICLFFVGPIAVAAAASNDEDDG